MKKFTRYFTIIVLALTLSACQFFKTNTKTPEPGGKPTAAQQLGNASTAATNATQVADDKAAKEKEQTEQLLAKTKANITSARESNKANPDGVPKVKVDGELGIAQGRLDKVEEDPAELAASRGRDLLVEQGKTAEARAAYEKATGDAKSQAAALAEAQNETKNALIERDNARAHELSEINNYKSQMAQNQKDFERRLREANDETLRMQVRGLNVAAIACLVLFGLGVGFGGPAGLKMTWPFGVIAALCFGLAQLISQWWFMYACGGAVLIALGCAGWWVWSHYKLGTLKTDAEEKAGQFNGLLNQILPVLDKAYENAKEDEKKLLDTMVFDPLSKKMNRDEKSLIHTVRAAEPAAPVV